jgi:23S rRNA (uracil1939-C5)-methyltransferase
VRDSLARIGKINDIPVLPVLPSPVMKAYRNKMSFAFAPRTEAGPALGLRQAGTCSLVEVRACGLQPPVVMRILDAVRANAAHLGLAAWNWQKKDPAAKGEERSGYLRFLVVHTPAYTPGGMPQILLEFITGRNHEGAVDCGGKNSTAALSNAEALRRLAEALVAEFPLTGVVHSERSRVTDVALGERPVQSFGSRDYLERFGHLLLRVPYSVFLQTNTGAAALLYEQIGREAALDPAYTLWDVYAGCGSIGLYLAEKVRMVHGFEIREDAVRAADNNKRALRYAHCHFHVGALKPIALETLPRPDVVVIDPPRSGVEEEVMQVLLHAPAKTLLYVSCDAATQARDAARLSSVWTAVKSLPVDMFPYTPHVENLLIFKRK